MPYSNAITLHSGSLALHSAELRVHQLLRTGQVLHATVLTGHDKGQVTLQIGQHTIQAQSGIPLHHQQQLVLRVIQDKPGVVLQPVTNQSPEAAVRTDPLRGAMPRLIAQQSGWQGLLQSMAIASRQPQADPVIRMMANQIMQTIPKHTALLNAEGIQAALRQSGLFMEASLKTPGPRPPADLKSMLSQHLQLVRERHPVPVSTRTRSASTPQHQPVTTSSVPLPLPGKPPVAQPGVELARINTQAEVPDIGGIIKQITGTIARITLHQVNSAGITNDAFPLWQFEIPVRHDERVDILSLTIQQDGSHEQAEQEQGWKLDMAVDLPKLGSLQIHLGLTGERLTAVIWCEKRETVGLLEQYLPELDSRLRAHGLPVSTMKCLHGHPDAVQQHISPAPILDCIA